MTDSSAHIRRESRPFAFGDLYPGAQEVFAQVLGHLKAQYDLLADHRREAIDSHVGFIDHNNHSRCIFVSGSRGSGKTSLLESLVHALDTRPSKFRDIRASDPSGKPKDPLQEAAEANTMALTNAVIVLPTLDLDPQPRPQNLLTAILTRLAFSLGQHGQARPSPALWEPEKSPQVKLAKLLDDVTGAWDKDVYTRRDGMTDAEVVRLERLRIEINEHLHRVLEGIHDEKLFPQAKPNGPLFLLPVDDFDLAPQRAPELLKLLRFLSAPRLATLIFGDFRVLRQVLLSYYGREFQQSGSLEVFGLGSMRSLASEVAHNVLKKLIPPSHVYSLRNLSVEQALAFSPSADIGSEKGKETLGSLFDRIVVAADDEKMPFTFMDLLTARVPGPDEDVTASSSAGRTQSTHDKYPYPGCRFLETSVRRLSDMWHGLKRILNATRLVNNRLPTAETVTLIRNALRDSIQGDTALSIGAKIALEKAVDRDFEGKPSLNMDNIEYETRPGAAERIAPAGGMGHALVAHRPRDWNFFVRPGHATSGAAGDENRETGTRSSGDGTSSRREREQPNERTAAALMVYHDVLAMQSPSQTVAERNVVFFGATLRWMGTEWSTADDTYTVSWPLPQWQTFWNVNLLRHSWARAWDELKSKRQDGEDPLRLAACATEHWVVCIARVLENWWTRGDEREALAKKLPKELWSAIAGLLDRIESETRRTRFSRTCQDWCIRLALLAAPECGASLTLSRKGQRSRQSQLAGRLRQTWEKHKGHIRRLRTEEAKKLARVDPVLAQVLFNPLHLLESTRGELERVVNETSGSDVARFRQRLGLGRKRKKRGPGPEPKPETGAWWTASLRDNLDFAIEFALSRYGGTAADGRDRQLIATLHGLSHYAGVVAESIENEINRDYPVDFAHVPIDHGRS